MSSGEVSVVTDRSISASAANTCTTLELLAALFDLRNVIQFRHKASYGFILAFCKSAHGFKLHKDIQADNALLKVVIPHRPPPLDRDFAFAGSLLVHLPQKLDEPVL